MNSSFNAMDQMFIHLTGKPESELSKRKKIIRFPFKVSTTTTTTTTSCSSNRHQ